MIRLYMFIIERSFPGHLRRSRGVGDAYRKRLEVREDEVPADLLSRLRKNPPQFPHSAVEA